MGIIASQSLKNTISTYLGFCFGAINTLFLYTNFLSDTYYGLVAFILSAANIMMPIVGFGIHNAIVKFYSGYKVKDELDSFLTLMLFLPLLIIIPVSLLGYVAYNSIYEFLSSKNEIAGNYLGYIIIIASAMAYFEIFYAWTKVHLKTVFGNVMKEVFHRILIMILLIGVNFEYLTPNQFLTSLVVVYVLRMLVMKFYAYTIKFPVVKFIRVQNIKDVITYATLMIVAGSIAMIILDIDKFMIGVMVEDIENVAYYSVAIFIATVISVPQRAMHQIMLPLTAKYLNAQDNLALKELYIKSSLNLFIVSGLIFLLIVLNLKQLYIILPEEFTGGLLVVIVVGLAKLYDNALGNNNAILFNSNHYRMVLLFGAMLTLAAIILNLVLIPMLGINGSAIATFIAIALYNTMKILYVRRKFRIQPFTYRTFMVLCIIVVMATIFYLWDFPFHPLVNIVLKSLVISVVYLFIIFKLQVSDDISIQIKKYL